MDFEEEDDDVGDTDTLWLEDGTSIRDVTEANSECNSDFRNINELTGSMDVAAEDAVGLGQGYVVNRIGLEEYPEQGRMYTEEALKQLKTTQEFQRWDQKCSMCGACWYEGQYSQYCVECGTSPMLKLCPICRGRCGKVWKRDVEMSHQFHEAHWNGECHLPHAEQMALMIHNMEPTEDSFLQAISDL